VIDLYYWPTPNCRKVSIMLEECELRYEIKPINITSGDQFSPEFMEINPNNRIPAIVDHGATGGKINVFESGAILVYLAEKTGRFLPTEPRARVEALKWLFWQVSGLGPMSGQAQHFRRYSSDKIPYAVDRYTREVNRLYGVMDRTLEARPCLAGDYSIADMACYPWIARFEWMGQDLAEFPHLARWYEELGRRPGVVKGRAKAESLLADSAPPDEAHAVLFGQTADSVSKRQKR
jgi:GST-like protein